MSSVFNRVIEAQSTLYRSCGFKLSNFMPEIESKEYYAHYYKLENKHIRFRISKVTPTKSGQFVTLWKRENSGPIKPYDQTDNIDHFVINVFNNDRLGQFIFPKSILVKKNIFSVNGKGGKRAIRVYSPWDITSSKQAKSTKEWQQQYFVDITTEKTLNIELAKRLYSI